MGKPKRGAICPACKSRNTIEIMAGANGWICNRCNFTFSQQGCMGVLLLIIAIPVAISLLAAGTLWHYSA